VKKIHIEFDFATTQRMWVLSSMEAVADVRCVGSQKLTSHVLYYGTASVVAAQIRDEVHAPSPLLTVALPDITPKHE
jgi:hypothetical protein